MRSEAEMLELILGFAEKDSRVRAAALGGSRADPGGHTDALSDYDVIFGVTEVAGFTADHGWVEVFGEIAVIQLPETFSMADYPPENDGHFTYLMQFADGTRIDLTLQPLENLRAAVTAEPGRPLLDKDGLFEGLFAGPPDAAVYHIKPPSAKNYADCCNEFWWVAPYVAKGLWRGQMLYAVRHLDQVVRPMLYRMLEWQAGAENGFAISAGGSDKYLPKYLPAETTAALLATCRAGSAEECWQSLYGCCALFRQAAGRVAELLGFTYNEAEDSGATAYLDRLRAAKPGQAPF